MAEVTVDDLFNRIGRLLIESDQQKRDIASMSRQLQACEEDFAALRELHAPPKKKAKK